MINTNEEWCKEMTRLMSVKDTRWAFYEAMENGGREAMADYFETLYHHYQRRGQLLKQQVKEN